MIARKILDISIGQKTNASDVERGKVNQLLESSLNCYLSKLKYPKLSKSFFLSNVSLREYFEPGRV